MEFIAFEINYKKNKYLNNIKINFTLSQSSSSPDIVNQSSQSFQTIVTVRNFGPAAAPTATPTP